MHKILVVDDDYEILKLMSTALTMQNYDVVTMQRVNLPLQCHDFQGYDLILLDVMMPNVTGTEICKVLRDQIATPLVFVTAKDSETDIITGLSVGGDDYIVKPFSLKQLTAKVAAHLKREERHHQAEHSFAHVRRDLGPVTFYLEAQEVVVNGRQVPLTHREYAILALLSARPSKIYTKEAIYDHVYDDDASALLRSVPEYIYQIRIKMNRFGIDPIQTVRGVGYKWHD